VIVLILTWATGALPDLHQARIRTPTANLHLLLELVVRLSAAKEIPALPDELTAPAATSGSTKLAKAARSLTTLAKQA